MSTKLLSFVDLNPASWIKLADGRPILMERLVQSETYRGLLMGLPNERANQGILGHARRSAREQLGDFAEAYLIEPAMVPFTAQQQARKFSKEGLGEAEGEVTNVTDYRLPLVKCMAVFRCPEPLAPVEPIALFTYSAAIVVWFQEKYAMPIAKEAFDEIRLMDWTKVAADVSD